jgi:hypothetical protein
MRRTVDTSEELHRLMTTEETREARKTTHTMIICLELLALLPRIMTHSFTINEFALVLYRVIASIVSMKCWTRFWVILNHGIVTIFGGINHIDTNQIMLKITDVQSTPGYCCGPSKSEKVTLVWLLQTASFRLILV